VSQFTLQVLDIVFLVFHTALVLFNLLGWIWPKTRRWNLYCLAATAISWFVMGYWYGLGYCICTDWHFSIRRQLGYQDDVQTYIQLIIKMLSGYKLDANLIQTITGLGALFATVMSVATNLRDWKNRKSSRLTA
jgi:Protein of Unknown function (DUF2784)